MQQELIKKYAGFVVQSGVNIQPGQTLLLTAPVEVAGFARMCAEAAYAQGAKEVVVRYVDAAMDRVRMEHTAVEVLEEVKPWKLASYMDYYTGDGSFATLRITADDPEAFSGLDTGKLNRASSAGSRAMKPVHELTMANRVQWCVAAAAGGAWARRVFPQLAPDAAVEKLWDAILQACRVTAGSDPAAEWQRHVESLAARCAFLNRHRFAALHLRSAGGTDLEVGLADEHIWQGGGESSTGGVPFLANIPTEEVFTAPHRLRTNGVVKSSLPYVYNGNLIEGITVRFAQGVAVEYTAEKGGDLLQQMLEVDEGAKHLGEIALVPQGSPIRRSGVLFYNTLFDENAACHMAFGAGYPGTVQGGDTMPRETLQSLGVNDSLIHEDIMIGTTDMDIDGITPEGGRIAVFRRGEWAF